MRSVAVYCGSSPGTDPAYRQAAELLGRSLAEAGCAVVYGGSRTGLMGAVADAALQAGGKVVGVIPDALVSREIAHRGLTDLHVVRGMHERKAKMNELAEAFVALPGGIGTIDEIVEMFTWTQLGIHRKPCALLNLGGYYETLLAFLRHAVGQGFLRQAQLDELLVLDGVEGLLPRLAAAAALLAGSHPRKPVPAP
jgi:uncharacterized protein (TIGR00730 family)